MKVESGVPQGRVLGTLVYLFLLNINDIGDRVNGNLGLFADDSVLYGVVDNNQDA